MLTIGIIKTFLKESLRLQI